MENTYAFTVKYVASDQYIENINDNKYDQEVFQYWNGIGVDIIKSVKEYDSKGRIHYHGIFKVKPRIWLKKLIVDNYSVRFTKIYDMAGWDWYIHKDIKRTQSPDIVIPKRSLFHKAI